MPSSQFLVYLFSGITLTLLCSSCESATGNRPGIYTQPYITATASPLPEPGIVYFWPETVFEWSIDFVVIKQQTYVKVPGKADKPKDGTKPEFKISLAPGSDSINLNTEVRPDYDLGFFIPTRLMAAPKTDVKKLKVTLTDDLILQGIGGEFDDKRADIAGNIIKIGLTLAKLATGVPLIKDFQPEEYLKEEVLDKHKYTFIRQITYDEIKVADEGSFKAVRGDSDFENFIQRVLEGLKKDPKSGIGATYTAPEILTSFKEFALKFKQDGSPTSYTNSKAVYDTLKDHKSYIYPTRKKGAETPKEWIDEEYFRGIPYRIPGRINISLSQDGETMKSIYHNLGESGNIGFVDLSGDKWIDSTYNVSFNTATGGLKEYEVTTSSAAEQISSVISEQLVEAGQAYQAIQTAKKEDNEEQEDANNDLAVYLKEQEIADENIVLQRAIKDMADFEKDIAATNDPAEIKTLEKAIKDSSDLIDKTQNKLRTLERQLYYLKLGYSVE